MIINWFGMSADRAVRRILGRAILDLACLADIRGEAALKQACAHMREAIASVDEHIQKRDLEMGGRQ